MTTYTSFKPSVQFLEAGEKGQQFANAANTFKPLLPQEARQSIEGIDKVSQAFTATGRALEHFGFDEAEPEVTTSEVELSPTDNSPVANNLGTHWLDSMYPNFVPDSLRPSTYVIGAGEHLQGNGWESLGKDVKAAGQTMRAFGFDEAEFDQDQEEVGGKWSNRWNKFKKVVDGIDKINNFRKEMGFDADATESVGSDIDFGSAETLSDQSSPEFTDTSYSSLQGNEPGGDEAVGGWGTIVARGIKYGYRAYQAYQAGRQAGLWDEHEPESGDTLDTGFDQLNDSAFDSLTGSQAATNNSIYQDADVGGDEAVGGKGRVIAKGIKYGYQIYQMGKEFGFWDEAETISPDLNGPLDSFGEMPAGYVPGEHDFNPSGVNPMIPGIDASFGTNTEIPLA